MQFWWFALAHADAILFFADVPLLHRLGPSAGGLVTLALFSLEVLVCSILACSKVPARLALAVLEKLFDRKQACRSDEKEQAKIWPATKGRRKC